MLAAQQALVPRHEAVVRAPFAAASEQPPFQFSIASLDKLRDKIHTIPSLLRAICVERRELAGRDFDVFYVHDDLSLYVYGAVARLTGATVVRHSHMRATGGMEYIRSRLAHHTIHISEHAKSDAADRVIRNPLRSLDIQRRPVAGKLVVAGSICARKNQLFAIETLAALSRHSFGGRLHLCGEIIEPDYARRIAGRAAELNLTDRVLFEGFVPPMAYLESADVLLMPSTYENQPLGLLEAIAAGVPVVASDIAAHRELEALGCLNARNIRPLDPEIFARAVLDDCAVTPENALRVTELFSEQKFAAALLAFFAKLESQMTVKEATPGRSGGQIR